MARGKSGRGMVTSQIDTCISCCSENGSNLEGMSRSPAVNLTCCLREDKTSRIF